MTARGDFLFEIGTEELPPRALAGLKAALGEGIKQGLISARLGFDDMTTYATPRRLAVLVQNLVTAQPDTVEERRGPSLTAAFDDDGAPTQAALGFARSCGVDVNALETMETDKGAWLVFRRSLRGRATSELLPAIAEEALRRLPIPKRMRWGALREEFVRPVHWVVMLLGDEIVPGRLFGLEAGRETRGHRFHHPGALYLAEPAAYAPLLESEGHVMADHDARREAVRAQVSEAAVAAGGLAVVDEQLLEEVTSMVEWPVAVTGDFDRRFLDVPPEALISAMKGHQKYFHVVDRDGRLLPRFVTVSNIESRDMAVVRAGNERVIRPRLADAVFFWNQDRKRGLADQMKRLQQVVFHRKLGTLYEKTQRIAELATRVARELGARPEWAERAGWLSKCDLMTEMVGEFPELQGIMGRYYAAHDGEPEEVAGALEEQYWPRFAGDEPPRTTTGQALSIADKLDTLVGIFGIGQSPSGEKDPFALRRAALGVLRTAIERALPLDLIELLEAAAAGYRKQDRKLAARVVDEVYEFMTERLRAYYHDAGIEPEVFEAVLSRRPTRPSDFDARLQAVGAFRGLPEAESLAAANKRIRNILRKSDGEIPERVDPSLLQEDAEQALAKAVSSRAEETAPLIERGDYAEALRRLATLRGPVDAYFDEVLVMSDDAAVRANRLAQLRALQRLFMQVADLSCLHGPG